MTLSHCRLGDFTLYTIETGRFGLDGGAMFGVVPRTLWSRAIAPDEKNRIPLAMRCLLIHSSHTGRLYLTDTGIGHKFPVKFEQIYDIDHSHSDLATSLDTHGFSASDITDVILTHLHFDHCGGTSYYDSEGESKLTFSGARHWITEGQWETANSPNMRENASFLEENLRPLRELSDLELVPARHEFEDGLSTVLVNGHTIGQQLVRIESQGHIILFAADLLPTAAHVPLPWVMGYDMHPVQTLEEKARILREYTQPNHYLYLEHDAENELIRIGEEDGRFTVVQSLTLPEITGTD